LTKDVERSDPFQRTTDVEMKLPPLTVRTKSGPPAVTEVGLTPVTLGIGFAVVIVNVTEFEFPPPGVGVKTVTEALPALMMSLA
jgi:hypothetical protein